MLQDAHKGLEVMSAACNALKGEEWGQAERCLIEIQQITTRLLREVGEKSRKTMMAPKPDSGDRG
jgi:hypothetical protein